MINISTGCHYSSKDLHQPPGEDIQQKVKQIQNARKRLDQTLWSKEILAQQYEEIFIKLWDDLRASYDKFAVLKNFQFEQLVTGNPLDPQPHEWGITVTHFSPAEKSMQYDEWIDLLTEMEKNGYQIVQSEWHHTKFSYESRKKATSIFSVILHISQTDSTYRAILKAKIKVVWSAQKDEQGYFIPKIIKAEDVQMIEQKQQETVFEEILQFDLMSYLSKVPSIIVYDLNEDSLPEIISPSSNRIFFNQGHGQFVEKRLLTEAVENTGAALLADFTNDGIPDLFITRRNGFPLLFKGRGKGDFEDSPQVIHATKEPLTEPSTLTAGDIDQDGDLDIWIGQYKQPFIFGQMPTPYYDANDGYPSYLLINSGHGEFHEATVQSGLGEKRFRRSYTSSFVDLDQDGDLDLLTVNDFSGIDVYFNDGNGQFKNVTKYSVDDRTNFGMSHAFGDFNLDGKLDIFVVGMSSSTVSRLTGLGLTRAGFSKHDKMRLPMSYGNKMYFGQDKAGIFKKSAFNGHIARTGWSWGTSSFDVDNDGDLDLYIGNGHISGATAKDYCTRFWTHDIYSGDSLPNKALNNFFYHNVRRKFEEGMSWNGFEHNYLFMNESGKDFLDIAFLTKTAFEYDTRTVISEDIDLDGRMDLIITEFSGITHVLRNTWPNVNNWIGLSLSETSGQSPIGAKIMIRYPSGKQQTQIITGDSFYGQNSFNVHFGLGKVSQVDSIKIHWTNGRILELRNPEINRYHQLNTIQDAP